jgi:hypothetical protein|nr:MAG TPA: hypothetical protein [Bacteriophage sp.]
MTPIINPWLFYLVDVIGNLKIMCCLFPLAILCVVLLWGVCDEDTNEEKLTNLFKKWFIVTIVSLTFSLFLPSKKTCYQMMISSQVTDLRFVGQGLE